MNRTQLRYAITVLLTLGSFVAQPKNVSASGLTSGHYVFRAQYAPVCLNGTYPITLGYMTAGSTLTVATDAAGNLNGVIVGRTLSSPITGTIGMGTLAGTTNNVLLQAQTTGSNSAGESGDFFAFLHGTQFLGDAEDADGDVRFTMNVPSAYPLIVTFDVNLTVDAQGNVSGSGIASSCALDVPVTVTGTSAANCTLHIVGTNLPQFTWDGSGPATLFGFVASWNAHGYGFTPNGSQLPIFAPNAPGLTPYVTSRKNHLLPFNHNPAFAAFDINLPTSGATGIECRSGGLMGNHQLVIRFPKDVTLNPPTGTPAVRVSSGIGSVSAFLVTNNEVTVNLTGVPEVQKITVTLSGVSDGTNTADVVVPAGFVVGDTTGNGVVNSSDIAQTQTQSGQSLTSANCRTDVNLNGQINSSDIGLVQSKSGTGFPSTAPVRNDRTSRMRRWSTKNQ